MDYTMHPLRYSITLNSTDEGQTWYWVKKLVTQWEQENIVHVNIEDTYLQPMLYILWGYTYMSRAYIKHYWAASYGGGCERWNEN